ncbi:ATP-binding protein [Stagnihabitans tardus]|uniref:histidine kinase n=1 Tax=Stagnihabitans tardus TaxID=2699202 RepID=A0AAE5BU87_9RHOB|nr:ATP-binding protein [Stagnihabitans tardus]NBZ86992.1 two-component sensor histidine kinase [Stagnihabitans tardus]
MTSIERRLALIVGLGATLFWLLAAGLTADRVSREIRTLFDEDLRATAERLLPLASRGFGERSHDGEDDDHDERREEHDRDRDDLRAVQVFVVRDGAGQVVLRSPGGTDAILPPGLAPGFSDSATHRLYTAEGGGLTISVAAPLTGRTALVQALMLRLVLPLVVLLPLSLLGIAWAVRRGLSPLRALRAEVAARGVQDLSPLPETGLPSELQPITQALNGLFTRLGAGFEAERNFASHAAHELRTPVAGAIAQLQRLRAETPEAAPRAAEIEATLKRLMRTSEKLMQLARAEGGRMRGASSDIRAVLRIVVQDATREGGDCRLALPEEPVLSVIEPDALGILARNLVENALRHGAPDQPVTVTLSANRLTVTNAGPVLSATDIARLGQRFEKGEGSQGTGLGLAIVRTIAERAGAGLSVTSPAPGRADGVEVALSLPGA